MRPGDRPNSVVTRRLSRRRAQGRPTSQRLRWDGAPIRVERARGLVRRSKQGASRRAWRRSRRCACRSGACVRSGASAAPSNRSVRDRGAVAAPPRTRRRNLPRDGLVAGTEIGAARRALCRIRHGARDRRRDAPHALGVFHRAGQERRGGADRTRRRSSNACGGIAATRSSRQDHARVCRRRALECRGERRPVGRHRVDRPARGSDRRGARVREAANGAGRTREAAHRPRESPGKSRFRLACARAGRGRRAREAHGVGDEAAGAQDTRRGAVRQALIAVVVLLNACASASPPPGGPEDKTPPILLRVTPDTNALNRHPDNVSFFFDKVINDRGTGAQEVDSYFLVSPSDGAANVNWHRSRIDVRPRHGFRDNTAYTITLLPGLSDLRNNKMKDGMSLVFSTGATIPKERITGIAFDWIAERPAQAYIEAITPDSVTYLAQADTLGKFVVGPLPPGTYLVRGIIDQNNNRALDRNEPFDTVRVTVPQAKPVELLTTLRDTLPARILSVAASASEAKGRFHGGEGCTDATRGGQTSSNAMSDPRRALPSVSALLESAGVRALLESAPRGVVVDAVRAVVSHARFDSTSAPIAESEWMSAIADRIRLAQQASLRPVLNATGNVLHMKHGRAPLTPYTHY